MIDLTAVIDNDDAIRKLNELKSVAKNTTSSIVTDADRMDVAIGKFTRTLGAIGVTTSLGVLSKQIAQVRGESQQLEVAFNTMLQSEDKANALLSQLTHTAAVTPFGLQDVASGAKQLLAYGTSADKVNETLIRLGDIAAGLSIPLGDLVYLFGTTMTQGRLYSQDFNQFLGRGIPIAEELAKQFGITKAQVKEYVTEGKIGFEQVEKAIVSMTSEGGKFGGLMEAQSRTIVGQMSNLEDAIDMMFNEIGKSSQGAISGAISLTASLVENYEAVIDVLSVLVSTYGAYRTALILTAAAEKISAAVKGQMAVEVALLGGKMRGLTKAQLAQVAINKLLLASWKSLSTAVIATSKALLASPVTWITAALAALGSIIYFCVTAETAEEKALKRLNAEREKEKQLAEERKSTAQSLISTINDETSTIYMKEKAYAELVSKYPELLKRYTEEELKTKAQTDANKELLKSINDIEDAKARQSAQQRYDSAKGRYESYSRQINYVASTPNAGGGAIIALTKQRDIAKNEMDEAKKELSEIDRLRKEAEFNNAPTDIKIASLQKNIDELKRQEKELDTLIAGVKQKHGESPVGYFSSFLTEDSLQEQKQANVKQQKEIETQIADIQKGQKTTKNKSFWEKQKKDAEAAIEAMDISQKGTAQWNKQLKLIREAEAALAKYNTTTKATAKISEERVRASEQLQELEMSNARAFASLEPNDKKKREQEIELEYLREKSQIEKEIREFSKRNKDIGANGLNELGLTKDQQKAIDDARKAAEESYSKAQVDLYKQEAQAMRDYLKEYGTYQQKKLAITEEYAEKIAKASSPAERMSLQKGYKNDVDQIEAGNLAMDINWAAAFGEFGSMFADVIRPTLEKLEAYTATDSFKRMDHSSQKDIISAISQMREATDDSSHLNFQEVGEKVAVYQSALSRLTEATEAEVQAYQRLSEAQSNYDKALQDGKDGIAELDALIVAQKQAEEASSNVDTAQKDVTEANSAVVDSAKGLSEGMKEVLESIQGIASGSIKQGVQGLVSVLSNAPGKVGDAIGKVSNSLKNVPIIGWILSIIDVLKDGLSNLIGGLLDAIFNAVSGILSDVLSGDLLKTIVESIMNGIGKIFDAISFGGFSSMVDSINGSNAKETAELIDRLTKSNELLKQSIDDLKDEISNSYGTKTITATQAAIDAQERYNENLRQILDARMGYHNSHHSNAYYWNLQDSSLQQINDLLRTTLSNSWADFSKLTAEQMQKIRAYLPEIWNEMINQGKYGERFEDDWNAYADAAGEIEELINTLNESLTQISFESMRDDFIESLMDMGKSAKDFTNDFAEMFQRALLSFAIGDKFDERLKKWYEDFAKKMQETKGKLTETQINALRQQYNQMVEEALNERDQLANITGYDKSADAQSATQRGFQTMDQDTGSELNGRFTDMQGKMAEQLGLSRQTIEHIAYIRALSEQQLNMKIDTRDIMIQMAANVADIKVNSDLLPLIHEGITKTNKLLDEKL